MDAQADLSLRFAHTHFVGFAMLRLKLNNPPVLFCVCVFFVRGMDTMEYFSVTRSPSVVGVGRDGKRLLRAILENKTTR